MEFRNLTPFGALSFSALAPDGQEHPVIAMKVGYRLEPIASQPGHCRAVVMDEEPMPLCMADTHYGEPGVSAVLEESDLAPFKPHCDVIVVGHAHAPAGRPARAWEAGLRITSTQPRRETSDPRAPLMLLDKSLRFTGPREFHRDLNGWHLTEPEPAVRVPLRWELAFGGSSQICNPRHAEDPEEPEYLLNEVCFSNPLGCGWLEQRHEALHQQQTGDVLDRLRAPQIEHREKPIVDLLRADHPAGPLDAPTMADVAADYGCTPAGFGIVGRAWAPRLALAGTYDQDWENNHWPGLPQDFDFTYWNGAPAGQQIEYPAPDAHITLFNLVDPQLSVDGRCAIQLPGHRPFVLMRMTNGVMLPLPLLTDTLRIDTDAMTLSMTHRISLPGALDIRVLEARFESDPAAPILVRASHNGREHA